MAGIYIHVPFCFSKCGYCDFFKSTRLHLVQKYVEVLKSELVHRSNLIDESIQTIYFGGGTPSLLDFDSLSEVMNTICNSFSIEENCEVTFEANPDDLSAQKIEALKSLGVNRISLGLQSMDNEDLKIMGRRHSVEQSCEVVNQINQVGISNISIDLIYGLPWSNTAAFNRTLELMQSLSFTHLSAYQLTIEPATPFYRRFKNSVLSESYENEVVKQYQLLCHIMRQMGYEHYEISNFCKPHYQSKHNSSYWKGAAYLGFGPGAHSFVNPQRFYNCSDLDLYLSSDFERITSVEMIDKGQMYNEMVMLGLRTSEGIDLDKVRLLNLECYHRLLKKGERWINDNVLEFCGTHLRCSESGWLLMDAVAEDLFEI